MKIPSESRAIIFVVLALRCSKNFLPYSLTEECWEVSLGNTNYWRSIWLIFLFWIRGNQWISRIFLSYPQLWIMLFISI
jgi:hypothetical protein